MISHITENGFNLTNNKTNYNNIFNLYSTIKSWFNKREI